MLGTHFRQHTAEIILVCGLSEFCHAPYPCLKYGRTGWFLTREAASLCSSLTKVDAASKPQFRLVVGSRPRPPISSRSCRLGRLRLLQFIVILEYLKLLLEPVVLTAHTPLPLHCRSSHVYKGEHYFSHHSFFLSFWKSFATAFHITIGVWGKVSFFPHSSSLRNAFMFYLATGFEWAPPSSVPLET